MSFTGRIRLYLVAIAFLPPALMMVVVYFYSSHQQSLTYQQNASEDLQRIVQYRAHFESSLHDVLDGVLKSNWFAQANYTYDAGRPGEIRVDASQFGLDFLEVLDSNHQVIASSHRPGLVGEQIHRDTVVGSLPPITIRPTVEFDIAGRHVSLTAVAYSNQSLRLYGGWYLNERFLPTAEQMLRGTTEVVYTNQTNPVTRRYGAMEFGALYKADNQYEALLCGSEAAGFFMVARFQQAEKSSVFASFFNVISIVALASVLVALALGIYISGKTRREIDNLVEAFSRVAAGDLGTTVMAYNEGEFSQLADSYSEMTRKLKVSRHKLATTEKIAAWQSMARKIAHEIKNP
ncbi:MAG: hypothetical protein DRP45_07080, partial [Candidatus Zixiibacteriota bacterium]